MNLQDVAKQAEIEGLKKQIEDLKQKLAKTQSESQTSYKEMKKAFLDLQRENTALENKIIELQTEKANEESFLRGQLIGQSNASSCCIAHLINEITFKQSSAACDADRQ